MEVFLHQVPECPQLLGLSVYCWFRNAEDNFALLEGIENSNSGSYLRAHTSSETVFPYDDTLVVVNGQKNRQNDLVITEIEPVKEDSELWCMLMEIPKRKLLFAQSERSIKVFKSHTKYDE